MRGNSTWGFEVRERRTPRLTTTAGTMSCCVFAMTVSSLSLGAQTAGRLWDDAHA